MINPSHILTHCRQSPGCFDRSIELFLFTKSNNKRSIAELHFSTVEEGVSPASSCNLPYDSAQKLMDQLWDCGLRPSEGTGSAGAIKAVQDHLNDMRAIVFKKQSDIKIKS